MKYSYTYSSIHLSAGLNLIANVEVENSSITNTEIVEYNHKTKDDFLTDEEWNKYLEYAEVGDISIDNVFSDCDDFNKNAEDYIVDGEYKDYYASYEVRFDKQYHFIESCLFTTLIMKEDVDGGSSSEISMRNFKAE